MITPELPPLPNPPLEYRHEGCTYIDRESFLEWHDQHSARERILLARVAANDDALSWIGELMAVMHADGGHYLAKHGMEKAIGDAMDKYHAMRRRIAELQGEADRRTREVEATYHVQARLNARIAELEAERWPDKPTPAMRDALRTGSRRDYPSDELCDVRYAALLAARCAK